MSNSAYGSVRNLINGNNKSKFLIAGLLFLLLTGSLGALTAMARDTATVDVTGTSGTNNNKSTKYVQFNTVITSSMTDKIIRITISNSG